MNKVETASYLVSLHTLMEAQSKGVFSRVTQALADEYNREWDNLKRKIKEEQDEAGKRNEQNGRSEAGADRARDQPESGKPVRQPRGAGESS